MTNPVWNALDASKRTELEALQLHREEEMMELGLTRYWRSNEEDGKPETDFIHEAGIYLMPAIEAVREEISSIYSTGSGRLPAWAPAFMWLSNEHMLVVLLKTLCPASMSIRQLSVLPTDHQSRPWDIMQQHAAREIASNIWTLSQYHEARRTFSDQWEKQSHYIKSWGPRQRLRFVKKVQGMNSLTLKAKMSLGLKLLEIAKIAGIAERRKVTSRTNGKLKTHVFYGLTQEIIQELHTRHDTLQWLKPKWQPMVAPPNDWQQDPEDGKWSGGYYAPGMQMSLIRPATQGYFNEGLTAVGDVTLEAVNAMQQTAFAVNTFIRDAMRISFEKNLQLGDTPEYELKEIDMARFEGIERDDEGKMTPEYFAHIRALEEKHSVWYKAEADRLRMISRLALADDLSSYPAYWLPITLDFRTRAYTSTEMLSPQGCDHDKSMAMFAEKKPQTSRGREWLKIHIANNFGVDKVSFQDRIDWVDEHEAELRASAADPIENTFWTTADDKHQWQALAAVHDLYVDPEFSTVPVQMDGSCNGIQHWSAMGRDTIGATATNLIDSLVPQDLYREVGFELERLLKLDEGVWAERWLPRVSRKLAKRPCMTYPYGVTRNGIQKALINDGFCKWLDQEEVVLGSGYITAQLMNAIPNVVYSSHHMMVWIKDVAAQVNKTGGVLTWDTPAGSTIEHRYYELDDRTLNVENQRIVFGVAAKDPVIDTNAAKNGIAPNFVHSMDGAHMQLSVVDMKDEGIASFSMIHDSYGCHATDVDVMQMCIRRQFVDMYTLADPIAEFAAKAAEDHGLELPALPTRGDFDINQVETARYFFS